jgi:hypothetical protein
MLPVSTLLSEFPDSVLQGFLKFFTHPVERRGFIHCFGLWPELLLIHRSGAKTREGKPGLRAGRYGDHREAEREQGADRCRDAREAKGRQGVGGADGAVSGDVAGTVAEMVAREIEEMVTQPSRPVNHILH